jgi:hypothetical protein
MQDETPPTARRSILSESVWDRRILPTHLCFKDDAEQKGYKCHRLDNLVSHKKFNDLKYAFISYSRRQFFTQNDAEIQSRKEDADKKGKPWTPGEERILRKQIDIDRHCLTRIALKAIEDSGLEAFYIDFECVDPTLLDPKGKARSVPPKYFPLVSDISQCATGYARRISHM